MKFKFVKLSLVLWMIILGTSICYGQTLTLFYDGTSHAYTDVPITLYVDERLVVTPMAPVQFNGYTLVPAREVFEQTGANVSWKASEQKVYIDNESDLLVLTIGSKLAWFNGIDVMLDMPAKLINNKVMIPTRFVAEALGYEVKWRGEDHSVHIFTKDNLKNEENNSNEITLPTEEDQIGEIEQSDPNAIDSTTGDWWLKLEHLVYNEEDESLTLTDLTGLTVDAVNVEEQYHTKQISIFIYGNFVDALPESTWFKPTGEIASLQIKHFNMGTQLLVTTRSIKALKVYEGEKGIVLQCVKPSEKYDKIIVIDAGHGDHDPGARAGGIEEKNLNLKFALALKNVLSQNPGIKVYMTREDDTFLELNERTEMANAIDPDLFISLHINSADNLSASGIETYYTTKADTRNKAFATIVQNALISTFGKKDRGVKSNTYVVTKNTNAPAILIEIGFISNDGDRAMMCADGFAEQYASVLYQCILDYYAQGYDY